VITVHKKHKTTYGLLKNINWITDSLGFKSTFSYEAFENYVAVKNN